MTRITQFARPKHRNFNTHVWHFLLFFVCQPKHGDDERRSERRVTRWKSSCMHGIGIAEHKRIIRFAFLIAMLLFRFRKLRDAPSITFGDHCKSSWWWENEAKKKRFKCSSMLQTKTTEKKAARWLWWCGWEKAIKSKVFEAIFFFRVWEAATCD